MANDLIEEGEHLFIDHVNHDTLDNRRCNLRVCTQLQNAQNRKKQKNVLYTGVKRDSRGSYRAMISNQGRKFYLGTFKTARDAALTRDKKVLELRGDFAVLNIA